MPENTWVQAAGVEEFFSTAIPYLAAEPARNTLMLTVSDRLGFIGPHAYGERDPELFTWYDGDGAVAGAALRTPPYGYILADVPRQAIEEFVDLLADPSNTLDGRQANLSVACEGLFIAAWTRRTGNAPKVAERMRLYRLEQLSVPDPLPPGRARLATQDDVAVVADWFDTFWLEVEGSYPAGTSITPVGAARARIEEGSIWVWEDEAGVPVSVAGHTPIVAGAGRIGPVFTPRDKRERGYAAAVTAAASRALLEHGAEEVLLFTDLANPTSNALYQRIGYREVSDRVRLDFEG